jgi:hypothetical protein
MPYSQHPDLLVPSDDTIIWRYQDLPKLLFLLEKKKLHFALKHQLVDKWEAILSKDMRDRLEALLPDSIKAIFDKTFRMEQTIIGVNCWHIGDWESVALWKLYTSQEYGTAIRCSVGKLKASFGHYKQDVFIGEVLYEDHEEVSRAPSISCDLKFAEPYFQKRRCYHQENELRALTVSPPKPKRGLSQRQGLLVDVDLSTLIESITLCSGFPTWGRILLDSALSRAGINPQIIKSDLLKPPSECGFS